ncbi:MAG: hypothetical protein ACQESG_05750 [Nanobdellota archaeon]
MIHEKTHIFVVLLMLVFTGCVNEEPNIVSEERNQASEERNQASEEGNQASDIEIMSFSTDNKTYGSYEKVNANAIVRSSADQTITARLSGIKPHTNPYIDESKIINLSEGENEIHFTATTPHCTSGCGGVYPGPYQLTLELLHGTVTSKNITIELIS